MNILYISNYRDGTGWGNAALNYMLAMDSVGLKIYPYKINYNNRNITPPERILELEKNTNYRECDTVIQHCLPNQWEYCGHFKKNIGVYFTETSYIANPTWITKLNLMDELWCCNPQMINVADISGVRPAKQLIPLPCNAAEYGGYYEPLNIPDLQNKFSFYTIVDTSSRKNLPALIKAFHLEFSPQEPVSLVLKITSEHDTPSNIGKKTNEIIFRIKQGFKLYPHISQYVQELVLTEYMDRATLLRLHQTCSCYVSASYGEAWQQPAMDAMAMGKTPIITGVGGPEYFMKTCNNEIAGWLIPYQETPCFGMMEAGKDIYTGRENWYEISIPELRKAMRQAYSDNELRKYKSKLGISQSKLFSYTNIGQKIKDSLCK